MAANDEHYNTTKVNDKPTADVQNDREVQENNVNEEVNSNDENYNEYNTFDMCLALDLIKSNMEELTNNTNSIHERIKRLEMDCLDLLQPMGSAIVLEKQLEKLKEIESKLMQKFKEFKNN